MDLSARNDLKASQDTSDPVRGQLNTTLDTGLHEDYDKHQIGGALGAPTVILDSSVPSLGKSPFAAREDHTHGYGAFPVGSAALPSIAFIGDPDTGMYWNSANVLAFATGGARRGYFDSTGFTSDSAIFADTFLYATQYVYAGSGTVSNPGFRFHTETNTGLYRRAANQLGFAVGGIADVYLYSGGFMLASGQWYRTNGDTGLYNQTHAVGVHFTDADWVRNYQNHGFYASNVNGHAGSAATGSMTGWQQLVRSNAFGTYAVFTSSIDFKRDVNKIEDSGDIIDKLRPVTFKEKIKEDDTPEIIAWKDSDLQYGFIAEDVAEVNPFLASLDSDLKPIAWDISGVLSVAIAEIKSLRSRVEVLEDLLAEKK